MNLLMVPSCGQSAGDIDVFAIALDESFADNSRRQ
jgi:hypothetical protein